MLLHFSGSSGVMCTSCMPSGVVVVHAQLHTLYELILWASQCPARVDIGSSGGEG